jgi:hypothetical protein
MFMLKVVTPVNGAVMPTNGYYRRIAIFTALCNSLVMKYAVIRLYTYGYD